MTTTLPKRIRHNTRAFNTILDSITTATLVGGGDSRLFTTTTDVVEACRNHDWWTLMGDGSGKYLISGSSGTWICS